MDFNEKDYPSNSSKSKEKKKEEVEEKEKRVIRKANTGKVIQRKKSIGTKFKEAFIGDESRSIGEYIIYDVLVFAAKGLVSDIVDGLGDSVRMSLFGDRRGRRSSNLLGDIGRKINTDYNRSFGNSVYRSTRDIGAGNDYRRDISRTSRARHDFGEIVLETRGDAEEVLLLMTELITKYGQATVADLYDILDLTIPGDPTGDRYGWTDLRGVTPRRVREGYLLGLPRTVLLD